MKDKTILNIIKSVINFSFKIFSLLLFRFEKNQITFLFHGYSGSNILPVLEKFQEEKSCEFKINVIDIPYIPFEGLKERLKFKWNLYKWIAKSKIVITTQGAFKLRKRTLIIELWHGFPTKKGGLMHIKSKYNSIPNVYCSYSEFGSILRNACLGIPGNRYYVTGAPRNDYLFNSNGIEELERILSMPIDHNNIIIYAPTWQNRFYNLTGSEFSFKDLFGFNEFNNESFLDFLEKNEIYFLIKPHPKVERILSSFKCNNFERVKFLSSTLLRDKKTDFYKTLNAASILITDYSSIYFDWLLLNKPVIFVPTNIEEYRQERGWLLEPYDIWMAGPKCFDQPSLEAEIEKCIEDGDYYKKARQWVLEIVHHYKDGNSTYRVKELIINLLKGE